MPNAKAELAAATAEDVRCAFLLFLGREPSPPSTVAKSLSQPPQATFVRLLMSHEFGEKVVEPAKRLSRIPHDQRSADDAALVRRWAMANLPLDAGTRRDVQTASWRGLLLGILRDSAFRRFVTAGPSSDGRLEQVLDVCAALPIEGVATQLASLADGRAIMQVYGLLFARMPGKRDLASKLGMPLGELADRMMASTEFLERVVPAFVRGQRDSVPAPRVRLSELGSILELLANVQCEPTGDALVGAQRRLELAFSRPDSPLSVALSKAQPKSPRARKWLDEFRRAVSAVRHLDSLTESGEVPAAYALARALVANGLGCCASRLVALDAIIRPDDANPEPFIADVAMSQDVNLGSAFSDTSTTEDPSFSLLVPTMKAELPRIYTSLLQAREDRSDLGEQSKVVEDFLSWRFAGDLGRYAVRLAPAPHVRVCFCFRLAVSSELDAAFLRFAAELSRRAPVGLFVRNAEGLAVSGAVPIQDASAAGVWLKQQSLAENDVVVCSSGTRHFSLSCITLLARLPETERRLTVATSVARGVRFSPNAFEVGGMVLERCQDAVVVRGEQSALDWLADEPSGQSPASARNGGERVALTVPAVAFRPEPPWGGSHVDSCLLVVESDTPLEVTAPTGTAVYNLRTRVLRVSSGASEVVAPVRLHNKLKADLPTLVLSETIDYPPNYVLDCLKLMERHGNKTPIATLAISYTNETGQFQAGARVPATFVAAACLATVVLPLGDAVPYLEETGAVAHRLIAPARPLLLVSLLSTEKGALPVGIEAAVLAWSRSAAARGVAFGAAPVRLKHQDLAGLNANTRRLVETHLRAQAKPLEKISTYLSTGQVQGSLDELLRDLPLPQLLESGDGEQLRRLAAKLLEPTTLLQLRVDGLKALVSLVMVAGLQETAARQIYPMVAELAAAQYKSIGKLFELLASALSPQAVGYAALNATARCLGKEQSRALFRLSEAIARYCDGDVMVQFLALVDARQSALLADEEFAANVGRALLVGGRRLLWLPNSRLTSADFEAHAPDEDLIVQAAQSGDEATASAIFRRHLARGESPRRLLDRLRAYSAELAELKIDSAAFPYFVYGDSSERFVLATLIGARDYIEACCNRPNTLRSQDVALGSTYLNDYSHLNALFAKWAQTEGLSPLTFGGTTIKQLFEELARQAPTRHSTTSGKVSVICTVYNPDMDLLTLAVRSVLNQTYQDFELIIVDDASQSSYQAPLTELVGTDPRIRLIALAQNGGPYRARNAALAVASGEFIALQDGDDFAHPEKIARQVRELRQNPHLVLCTTPHLRFDRLGRLQYEAKFEILGDGMATSLYRRRVFDELGGFLDVRSRGDVEYRHRIRQAYGSHVHSDVGCPTLFCLSSPSNLSNRIHQDYLKLFRTSFTLLHRRPLVRRTEGSFSAEVVVPAPLQP